MYSESNEGVDFVSRYETLLLELLRRLDEKADRLISLLEVRQDAEHSGHDSTNPGDGRKDGPQD